MNLFKNMIYESVQIAFNIVSVKYIISWDRLRRSWTTIFIPLHGYEQGWLWLWEYTSQRVTESEGSDVSRIGQANRKSFDEEDGITHMSMFCLLA